MTNRSRGIFRIGTSGIALPGSKESFPADFQLQSRLSYYASLFNTLEVNSTFKKIPRTATFEKWALDVGPDFQFTLKLWKEITHVKKLSIDFTNINTFVDASKHIGNKKGCLLLQFPASITAEYFSTAEEILLKLKELTIELNWRKAVEFRSLTWHNELTFDLIQKYEATLVLHDMPKSANLIPNEKLPFYYFRFHGAKGDYRGSYDNSFLEEQADKIRNALGNGKDVYAYFNNTMGDAFENAISLKSMVEK